MSTQTAPAPESWSAEGTTPGAIEGALRNLLKSMHVENGGFLPARALNMVAFVDRSQLDEVRERLRQTGRYHASRLVMLAYEPERTRLDAQAHVSADSDPGPGEHAVLRETITIELGSRHLDDLATIVDPLVVSDLPTLLWSPSGCREAVDELLGLSQALLIDSVDEPVWSEAIDRAEELSREIYVVDLAWLRSTPWRERIAATFDPPALRAELEEITQVRVRHHPDSTLAGLLAIGWLASRLGWCTAPLRREGDGLAGEIRCGRRPIELALEPAPEQQVRGLASVSLGTASGRMIRLDRGSGGLRAHLRDPDGSERSWTIIGASRGESGILGEGIRQALLRDETYRPALRAARGLT